MVLKELNFNYQQCTCSNFFQDYAIKTSRYDMNIEKQISTVMGKKTDSIFTKQIIPEKFFIIPETYSGLLKN